MNPNSDKTPMDPNFDHYSCTRIRLVGSCGALAACDHNGERIFTEWANFGRPVLAVTAGREAELRATFGPCV